MKEYWNELNTNGKIKLIFKVLLAIMALIFAIRNWESTPVILVFFKMNLPLTIIILLSLAIGFALASLFDYRKFKEKNKEIGELKSKISNFSSTKD